VLTCPDEPRCVRVDHLRVEEHAPRRPAQAPRRAVRGAGSIEALSRGVWKIGVTAGIDSDGKRRRTFRTVRGTRTDAAKALAALVTEVGDGSRLPRQADKQLTVDSLVEWYLVFAAEDRGLEHSTMFGYQDAYEHWLKDVLGTKRACSVTMADLDMVFGRMRRAGLSHSRMNQARSVLSGAYKWASATAR